MQLACQQCARRFEVEPDKVAGLTAVRCECGQSIALGGKGIARLGKYLLVHKIAVGGMGEIYYGVVSGIEGFEREVAIKKMLPHLSEDRSFIEMMVKEAKLTVLLNHPNIVQVYDLAREGDQYYIAMEYVPGVTIAHILQTAIRHEALLPVPLVVHVISQLLRGLMYAHNLQTPAGPTSIVHRDITPQNVLVTQQAAVKITDFGIARAVNEISTTSPGLIKGKMGYIAPEQLSGQAPSPQVDLFCAAIVAWEMLAGRRLFKGNTEVDTFRLIAQAEVPDIRTVRDDVPAALWEVLLRGLAKEPGNRFAHGDDFAAALLRAMAPLSADDLRQASQAFFRSQQKMFADIYVHDGVDANRAVAPSELTAVTRLATRPIAVPPPPPPVSAAQPGRRGAAIAAAALLVAGAGGATYWQWSRSGRPPAGQLGVPSPVAPPVASHLPVASDAPPPSASARPSAAPPSAAPESKPSTESPATAPEPAKPVPERSPKKARARHRATEPAEAKPLTGGEIQKTVAKHQAAIAQCLRGLDPATAPKEVAAKMTIGRDGSVVQVHFEPDFVGEQGQCVSKALSHIKFRPHPYEGLQVTIPLRLQVF